METIKHDGQGRYVSPRSKTCILCEKRIHVVKTKDQEISERIFDLVKINERLLDNNEQLLRINENLLKKVNEMSSKLDNLVLF